MFSDEITKIDLARLKAILHYEEATGLLIWKITLSNHGIAGAVAGCENPDGYIVVGVDGEVIMAHQLIWFLMTGYWPNKEVGHRDRSRSNNRWSNLRMMTKAQRNANGTRRKDNTSGHKGVSFVPKIKRWHAYIWFEKKRLHLGYFDEIEKAVMAYRSAAVKYYGEFARF